MTLTVREMCLLSAAAGWIVCAACFWLFKWARIDVHRMSYAEMRALLIALKNEYMERNPDKAGTAMYAGTAIDEAARIYDEEALREKSNGHG